MTEIYLRFGEPARSIVCRGRYNVADSLRVPEQEFELRAPDAALEELVSFTFLDAPPDQPDWGWAHVSLLALARSGSVFGACTPASHPTPAEKTIRYHLAEISNIVWSGALLLVLTMCRGGTGVCPVLPFGCHLPPRLLAGLAADTAQRQQLCLGAAAAAAEEAPVAGQPQVREACPFLCGPL
eukprot:COSAG01_NODE_535_length_15804_cov_33.841452_6_plen_183_part_00